jgi:hypothetical protein
VNANATANANVNANNVCLLCYCDYPKLHVNKQQMRSVDCNETMNINLDSKQTKAVHVYRGSDSQRRTVQSNTRSICVTQRENMCVCECVCVSVTVTDC